MSPQNARKMTRKEQNSHTCSFGSYCTYLTCFLRSSIALYALILVKSRGGGGGRLVGLPDPRRGCVGLEGPAVWGVTEGLDVLGVAVGLTGAETGLITSGTGDGMLTTWRAAFDAFRGSCCCIDRGQLARGGGVSPVDGGARAAGPIAAATCAGYIEAAG